MTHDGERTETTRDAAAEKLEHKHPGRPEQPGNAGFEQGYDQDRDTPEEERESNFARGISRETAPGTEHHGRFSEGAEKTGETPEKVVERRFSEGQERSPTSE